MEKLVNKIAVMLVPVVLASAGVWVAAQFPAAHLAFCSVP